MCVLSGKNAQVISDSYRNIGLLFYSTHLLGRQKHQAYNPKISKILLYYGTNFTEGQKSDDYFEYYNTTIWEANDSQVCRLKDIPFVTQLMNNAHNERHLSFNSNTAKFNAYKMRRIYDVYSLTNFGHIKRKEMRVVKVIMFNSRLKEVLRQYDKTGLPTTTS